MRSDYQSRQRQRGGATSQLRLGTYGQGLAGLLLLWPGRRRGRRIWAMLICSFALATTGSMSCGSGSGSTPTPETAKGSYNFTVTASSGNVQTQSGYTLVVQ